VLLDTTSTAGTSQASGCWGDDYYNRVSDYRMILTFHNAGTSPPGADVEFGPWPPPGPGTACPTCSVSLQSSQFAIRIAGHGQVSGPNVTLTLDCGDLPTMLETAGARSVEVRFTGFRCPRCKGVWLPGDEQVFRS